MSSKETEQRVSKIRNGTVIDHIRAGYALAVLKILGVTKESDKIVTMAMNVPSAKTGRKDIVKVEGRVLKRNELNKISLITPESTVNIIQDYEVKKKVEVSLPKKIEGTVSCINPNCITNAGEPIKPGFDVSSKDPLRLRCTYCGKFIEEMEILDQF
jgi:aspartate carbamoyltransferase regulatory subunit